MKRQFSAHEITTAIRRGADLYAAKDTHGDWGMYEVRRVCFIKEKASVPNLIRYCSDVEVERLNTMERFGLITCIPVSTSSGIFAITKRLVS
jgi:hypothetical protein